MLKKHLYVKYIHFIIFIFRNVIWHKIQYIHNTLSVHYHIFFIQNFQNVLLQQYFILFYFFAPKEKLTKQLLFEIKTFWSSEYRKLQKTSFRRFFAQNKPRKKEVTPHVHVFPPLIFSCRNQTLFHAAAIFM